MDSKQLKLYDRLLKRYADLVIYVNQDLWIREKAEQYPGVQYAKDIVKTDDLQHIAFAATQLVSDLMLKGIIVFTQSGRSAVIVSRCRPARIRIYAFTNSLKTQSTLILNRAVYPFLINFYDDFEETVQEALKNLRETDDFEKGDQMVVIYESVTNGGMVRSIQVRDVYGNHFPIHGKIQPTAIPGRF